MATFEKSRWASFKSSHKTGQPPNKKKQFTGTLRVYDLNLAASTTTTSPNAGSRLAHLTSKVDNAMAGGEKANRTQDLNLEGVHQGNFVQDAIVISAWIAVEAEHRLRWKIVDVLEEIGESFDGG